MHLIMNIGNFGKIKEIMMNAIQYYELKYMDKKMEHFVPENYSKMAIDEGLGERFMEILRNGEIATVFQPIISLKDGTLIGYEALSRGPGKSVFENPENLFDFARIHGKLWELEFLCRIKALENISKTNRDFNIFLNVDPDIIHDEKFKKGFTKEFLDKFDIKPENVVFEITEKSSIKDPESFKRVIENYKEQGYKIAIDDMGSGYSGLKLLTDIHPHYIKLDMGLIRDIDKDSLKYTLIKTLYEFCRVSDIKVIAEGIETQEEIKSLIDIEVDYGQGYFIQRPSRDFNDIKHDVINLIMQQNMKKSLFYNSRLSTVLAGDISRQCITISSSDTGNKALEIFGNNPSVLGIPVIDNNNKLAGLVMKDKFFSKLATQFGFSIFINRPVSLVMDNRPLSVDYNTTIDVVSRIAMARNGESLYDYIIVTKNSNYYGIVTIKDLLEKTTELEVNYAKHLNPLSGLPGNVLIEKKLTEIVSSKDEFTVLYIDIDNFKIYNDVYGFENGDMIIQFVSRIINECMAYSEKESFIGHVGGDDFIIVVKDYNCEILCENILNAFEKGILGFYREDDILKGYVIAKNRKGEEEQFNLATLSIAGITNNGHTYNNAYELSEYASKVKKDCKSIWDNCYIIR